MIDPLRSPFRPALIPESQLGDYGLTAGTKSKAITLRDGLKLTLRDGTALEGRN